MTFFLRQRRADDLHQLAAVQIAGSEQEVREEQHQQQLADAAAMPERAPHHVLADAERRRLDLHALHARRAAAALGGAVRRLLELRRRLLHLLMASAVAGRSSFERPAQTPRGVRQLLDDGAQPANAADTAARRPRRPARRRTTRPRAAAARAARTSARDHRIERVADEHAEHDRDDHRLARTAAAATAPSRRAPSARRCGCRRGTSTSGADRLRLGRCGRPSSRGLRSPLVWRLMPAAPPSAAPG